MFGPVSSSDKIMKYQYHCEINFKLSHRNGVPEKEPNNLVFLLTRSQLVFFDFNTGNIFVGQTESPLLIRPYIKELTLSEMHAVMTAGFGTVAGSTLGAYFAFGVSKNRVTGILLFTSISTVKY